MAEHENFTGFFSYAHHDGEIDRSLITSLTTRLENLVNAKVANARFTIWRDEKGLRTGSRWQPTIEDQLRRTDVLIVLLTPKWIESEYCRREYTIFEEVEALRAAGDYVAPILARPVEPQERHLTPQQRNLYNRISERQYFQANAKDFRQRPAAQRNAEIEKLADDIVGMIEQLRDLSGPAGGTAPAAESPIGRASEFPGIDSALAMGPLTVRTAGTVGDLHLPDLAVFRDAPFAPELVVIPAGEFMMGSPDDEDSAYPDERPQHRVMIDRRFAIGQFLLTFGEYDRFCEATRREKPGDAGWGRGRRPAINVNWLDAQAYVAWVSQETGQAYRLPSEAEWEYACRAGATTRYSFGDVITSREANYTGSALGRTSQVGAYPPNRWGLYDMHGNVWEWVEDDWHENYRGALTDASAGKDARLSSNSRVCVVRGGAWGVNSRSIRSACRTANDTANRSYVIGFRVARTLS